MEYQILKKIFVMNAITNISLKSPCSYVLPLIFTFEKNIAKNTHKKVEHSRKLSLQPLGELQFLSGAADFYCHWTNVAPSMIGLLTSSDSNQLIAQVGLMISGAILWNLINMNWLCYL